MLKKTTMRFKEVSREKVLNFTSEIFNEDLPEGTDLKMKAKTGSNGKNLVKVRCRALDDTGMEVLIKKVIEGLSDNKKS